MLAVPPQQTWARYHTISHMLWLLMLMVYSWPWKFKNKNEHKNAFHLWRHHHSLQFLPLSQFQFCVIPSAVIQYGSLPWYAILLQLDHFTYYEPVLLFDLCLWFSPINFPQQALWKHPLCLDEVCCLACTIFNACPGLSLHTLQM